MTHDGRIVYLFIMVSMMVLAGCLGPRRDAYVTNQTVATNQDAEQADRLWEAAREVLREHHFRLDRVDLREGVVTTMPAASQHFFEFWRRDVDTTPDFWEATLNPLRRWVEVRVGQAADDGQVRVAVIVRKERYSAPDRQFNNSGAAYQVFGYRLPTTTGQERIAPEHEHWIDIGRDHALEEHLLQAMLQRAGIAQEGEALAES
jgi:hypothetical protein